MHTEIYIYRDIHIHRKEWNAFISLGKHTDDKNILVGHLFNWILEKRNVIKEKIV